MAKIKWSSKTEIDNRQFELTDLQKLEAKFDLLKADHEKTKADLDGTKKDLASTKTKIK